MKTNVYVDGFNLYYGALRNTPYRWLDLARLSRLMFPAARINRIRYFTARVASRPNHPSQPQHQELYLRALGTTPNLTIHFGTFLQSSVRMTLASPPKNGSPSVRVVKSEEKGSDVNLASYLLLDAFDEEYEQAIVISNDSDLALPVQMVRDRFRLRVGIVSPHQKPSASLRQVSSFIRTIRRSPLSASQFPTKLVDGAGTFTKPKGW